MFSCGHLKASLFLFIFIFAPMLCSSTPGTQISLLKSKKQSVIQQFLLPHNKERARLGLAPLRWSRKLAKYAQWWAKQRQVDCELIHSRGDYGENLFWGSGKDWKPADAVAEWASERSYYNHNTNSCSHNKDCLHFTQIVWRQSLRVGCARVVCKYGRGTFIICNYFPHGNVVGQRPF